MTNSNHRLDRVENDLETVKEILMTVARRYEVAEQRMDATDRRIERLAQRTDERIERLAQKQERTQEQLDQLRVDIDITLQTIEAIAENTDREMAQFRSAMLGFQSAMLGLQTENQRIWEYLIQRDTNGNGDQPQR